MRKTIFTVIFSIATLLCYGQSFLSEYPKLTSKNLDEFFIDWKSYSDSIASKPTKYNNLIDSIQSIEYAPKILQGCSSPYTADSITSVPSQSDKTLYLTPDIYKVLSEFAGGLKRRKKAIKINEGNIQELKKYIPVEYGHWGGYWWFISFPVITEICYANNLIAVMRRTSCSIGDVIWYIKVNDKFVRQPVPVCEWIE